MNGQTIVVIVIGAVAVTAIGAYAGYQMAEDDGFADVISVTPNLETVQVPREVCEDRVVEQRKPVKDKHQITGTVAGAVIGGVLGNQVGDGSGQDIATAAGAIAGGVAGKKAHEKVQENNTETLVTSECRTVYDAQQKQDGYRVTYEVDGEQRVIVMSEDPGSRLRLDDNGRPISAL